MLKLNHLLNTDLTQAAQLTGLAEVEARDLEISYYPTHRTQLRELALKFPWREDKTHQTEKIQDTDCACLYFEIESHSAALAGLELITEQDGMASNLQRSICACLWNAAIKGKCHHVQLKKETEILKDQLNQDELELHS